MAWRLLDPVGEEGALRVEAEMTTNGVGMAAKIEAKRGGGGTAGPGSIRWRRQRGRELEKGEGRGL